MLIAMAMILLAVNTLRHFDDFQYRDISHETTMSQHPSAEATACSPTMSTCLYVSDELGQTTFCKAFARKMRGLCMIVREDCRAASLDTSVRLLGKLIGRLLAS